MSEYIDKYVELLQEANGNTVSSVAITDFIVSVYGYTKQTIEMLDDYSYYSLGLRDFEQVKELF